jgi:transposase
LLTIGVFWFPLKIPPSTRSGEKGGSAVGKTKRGEGTKWMVLADGKGIPLGVRLESASPNEVTLAEPTLVAVRVPRPRGRPRQKPAWVIADRGYDSDPLRERLKKRGIELIVPYRENNQARSYEDGRKLRRYKRRWIIERTNAWLG